MHLRSDPAQPSADYMIAIRIYVLYIRRPRWVGWLKLLSIHRCAATATRTIEFDPRESFLFLQLCGLPLRMHAAAQRVRDTHSFSFAAAELKADAAAPGASMQCLSFAAVCCLRMVRVH